MVPAKAPKTKAQRSFLTFSPKDKAAMRVTTKGVIEAMAVNSPTGMYFTPTNTHKLLPNSKTPRII
jgi:hypothetical protein